MQRGYSKNSKKIENICAPITSYTQLNTRQFVGYKDIDQCSGASQILVPSGIFIQRSFNQLVFPSVCFIVILFLMHCQSTLCLSLTMKGAIPMKHIII